VLFIQGYLSGSTQSLLSQTTRLLWVQYKLGLKLFTRNADHHAVQRRVQDQAAHTPYAVVTNLRVILWVIQTPMFI
jgi:hypothetical protein